MKLIIIIIQISVFAISCANSKSDNDLIEGKWRYEVTKMGCEIVFNNGLYDLTKWNDDLVNTSQGKYFINENKDRLVVTLTLVPNLQFSDGDTIMLPCENIDVVKITDSLLITKKATEWIRRIDGTAIRNNITETYIKLNH